jgi:hypothetical protein
MAVIEADRREKSCDEYQSPDNPREGEERFTHLAEGKPGLANADNRPNRNSGA